MLVRVIFPRQSSLIRRRCRKVRVETFLAETLVDIEEIAAACAPVAFRVAPPPAIVSFNGTVERGQPREVVLYRNRLFWPLFNRFETRPVPASEWVEELGKDFGSHINLRPHEGRFIPDVLHLRDLLDPGGRWPTQRLEDQIGLRYETHKLDQGAAYVARQASEIILRDGHIFIAGEEPVVWQVGSGLFVGELDPMRVFAADPEEILPQDNLPFLDFEMFPADRFSAAADRRRDFIATNPHCETHADDAAIEDLRLYRPRADLLTPMLRRLAFEIDQYVDWEVRLLHGGPNFLNRPKRSIAKLLAKPSTPAWLRSFAAWAHPIEDTAHQLACRFAALTEELQGSDLRFDLLGRAERLACAAQRAVVRWESDKTLGLLPPTARILTTVEDDEAIASLVV